MRKLFLMTMVLFISCLPVWLQNQDQIPMSGSVTETATYEFTELTGGRHKLTISGMGALPDYTDIYDQSDLPWKDWVPTIDEIVVSEGITSIGAYSFKTINAAKVSLPGTFTNIGAYAFYSNHQLEQITLPSSLETVGSRAFAHVSLSPLMRDIPVGFFRGCGSLETVTLPQPRFRQQNHRSLC